MRQYPSYKDSDVEYLGKVPNEWDIIKCGFLFNIVSIKNNVGEKNLSVYRDYGVILRESRSDNHNRVSEDISNYKLVEVGNFVFNKMKCWMGSLGVSDYRGIVSPSYTVCETTKPFDRKYLHHILRSKLYIQEFERLSYGVRVGQWELRFHDFKNILSPFPNIAEQKQISAYLDHKTQQIDTLIDKTQQKIELLKEQRTALINQVVTKGLDPNVEMKDSDVEWIGDIPNHWEKVKIKYLGSINSGEGLESNFIKKEGEFPVYGGNGIMGFYSKYNSNEETLIIGRVGEKCGNVHFENSKVWVNDNSLKFHLINEFTSLYYLFHSLTQRDLNQLRNKNTQPLITGTLVKNEYTPFPPIQEQQQIVDYLDDQTQKIDTLIEKENERTELLKEYRQSLISEVVTGKVDVREEVLV